MIASVGDRVSQNTASSVNEAIQRKTEENLMEMAHAGRAAIASRLEELDREWDIERYLETVAPSLTMVGMALGLSGNRRWFALPFFVQGFLLQHAVQGWCPPMPLLRRLGVRTANEINRERHALKAMRGDYRDVGGNHNRNPNEALEATDR